MADDLLLLQAELHDIIDLPDADNTPNEQRISLRLKDEQEHFNEDHYLYVYCILLFSFRLYVEGNRKGTVLPELRIYLFSSIMPWTGLSSETR